MRLTRVLVLNVKHNGDRTAYTRPYRLQTNRKPERFRKILLEECLTLVKETKTREELVAGIGVYMFRYNYRRRDGAIGYQTPLDKLKYVTGIMK